MRQIENQIFRPLAKGGKLKFYNLFLKTPEANTFRVELTNVPSDIKAMLDSVSRTQIRAKVIPSQSQEVSFKDINEFLNYFRTIVL